uniref:WAP domain-containing protein n=1 Tax=Anolis carolinensis TaxID=28377 RepID=A0A803ST72_ANOCA
MPALRWPPSSNSSDPGVDIRPQHGRNDWIVEVWEVANQEYLEGPVKGPHKPFLLFSGQQLCEGQGGVSQLLHLSSLPEKVGFCPKQSTVMDCDNVIVKCETDDNCPGYEKCCEQNCKKDCMTPYRLVE